ncbi:hypothetical protein [Aporhodopirellula aestuarii]|uniref:Secreted protein n=1 Tax=Aporhodopirellula aestuarii TaxID=2950107 RepID=A0ABT0U3H2_9BACT|nr:hypothetical protein [Aporhodopirellula aestuarii]MCM2371450.1 hypothetical protein [Aporhodopirellula aestuarii]
MTKKSQFVEPHWMMPCIMLLLFALPSFGITATVSRISLDRETQNQSEELEERVPCSVERRQRANLAEDSGLSILRVGTPYWEVVRTIDFPRALVGHRLSSDNLAPIRC